MKPRLTTQQSAPITDWLSRLDGPTTLPQSSANSRTEASR